MPQNTPPTTEPDGFVPGKAVTWLHQLRGGYVQPVDAVVVRSIAKTVRIEAPLVASGTKRVNVRPEHLRRRVLRP